MVFDWLLSFQGEPGLAFSLPKCEPGEYLTSDGKQLICVKFGTLCNTDLSHVSCHSSLLYSTNCDDAVSFKLVILHIRSGDKNNLEVILLRQAHPIYDLFF